MERKVGTIAEPMNAFTAAAEAGREPYKVKDILSSPNTGATRYASPSTRCRA